MIDAVFDELKRKQTFEDEKQSFKDNVSMKSSRSFKSQKSIDKISSVRQKKEILKEVLTVMKFTIGLNYKEEENLEIPFCCRIYFHDEEK